MWVYCHLYCQGSVRGTEEHDQERLRNYKLASRLVNDLLEKIPALFFSSHGLSMSCDTDLSTHV